MLFHQPTERVMRSVFTGTKSRYSDRDSFARISGRTMKKSAVAALLGGVALTMLGGVAHAGTAGSLFQVTATITSGCSVSASTVGFGSINPITATGALPAQGGLLVKCTGNTGYSIALDPGQNSGATPSVNSRKMKNSATSETLAYQLYQDSGRTTAWGNTMGTSLGGMGTGATQSIPVYAQIPDATQSTPGSYSDLITVSVSY